MSIEYFGTPSSPFTREQIRGVFSNIAADTGLVVVRDDLDSLGLTFPESQPARSFEDVTIAFDAGRAYVAFHNATRRQRERVIARLEELFRASGVSCPLGEV